MLSSNDQTWCPCLVSTTFGASASYFLGSRPSNMPGGSTRWSSTEITVYRTSRGSGSGNRSGCSSVSAMARPPLQILGCRAADRHLRLPELAVVPRPHPLGVDAHDDPLVHHELEDRPHVRAVLGSVVVALEDALGAPPVLV